ncbi:type II toxin-antitoxin system VapC family toxin [Microbaculum marinum]|uniref:Type II toxin-antitoxin system VapC family toxin n=1 Tax=Microbaculum marinum TaxID=1764581 RepID=A0AAW9S2M2_9HYPH
MTDTLVDTNVLIDVFGADPNWVEWSRSRLRAAAGNGELVVNPMVYAELSAMFPTQRQLDHALPRDRYRREDLPWDAAFNAGRAFLAYRRAGGAKRSPLPDFYIGAHAEIHGYDLLTRDPARYRQFFPMLKLVTPDTHP